MQTGIWNFLSYRRSVMNLQCAQQSRSELFRGVTCVCVSLEILSRPAGKWRSVRPWCQAEQFIMLGTDVEFLAYPVRSKAGPLPARGGALVRCPRGPGRKLGTFSYIRKRHSLYSSLSTRTFTNLHRALHRVVRHSQRRAQAVRAGLPGLRGRAHAPPLLSSSGAVFVTDRPTPPSD